MGADNLHLVLAKPQLPQYRACQRVRGPASGFRVQGAWFNVRDSGFRVKGAGCRVQGSGLRA
jgi:hypothetical protein